MVCFSTKNSAPDQLYNESEKSLCERGNVSSI